AEAVKFATAPPGPVASRVWLGGAKSEGAMVSCTVTETAALADAPWLSVAVNVRLWTPMGKLVVTMAVEPSGVEPSAQVNVKVSPTSGSLPEPVRVTLPPAGEVASTVGGAEAVTDGAWFDGLRTTKGER